jgi:hypothetical protein
MKEMVWLIVTSTGVNGTAYNGTALSTHCTAGNVVIKAFSCQKWLDKIKLPQGATPNAIPAITVLDNEAFCM